MALDGIFIGKLTEEIRNELVGSRIDTIDGLNKTDYFFRMRSKGRTLNLYMSVSSNNPTIFLTERKFEKPLVASGFTMYLRKYFEGGFITDIRQYNNDRVIMMDIETSSDFDGLSKKTICLELIGRFSNLLILDSKGKILEAIKQLSVLEDNSRGVMKGLDYEPLKNDKLSPIDKNGINEHFKDFDLINSKEIVSSISGISPLLGTYLEKGFKDSPFDNFFDFLSSVISKMEPTSTSNDYYFFDIFDTDKKEHFDTLSSLLYKNYIDNAEGKILRDNNQEIYRTVKQNLKRVTKKIEKLNEDLEKDKNADEYRIKGELLLANQYLDSKRSPVVVLNNYYTGEDIEIKIDPSKSFKDNSQAYYKKYRKSKIAVEYVEREIGLAENEKEYLTLLSFQLTKATLKDLVEIKEELISNGYIFSKERKGNSKKKKQRPNFLTINFNGCKIYVGKNNIQNEYITHEVASKDDLWFHVKYNHGSHVVVSGENRYSEQVIRKAAFLAATYSDSRDSSSVPIDYTEVKFLKKVPGRKGSFVTYKRNKTIYIDPKRED